MRADHLVVDKDYHNPAAVVVVRSVAQASRSVADLVEVEDVAGSAQRRELAVENLVRLCLEEDNLEVDLVAARHTVVVAEVDTWADEIVQGTAGTVAVLSWSPRASVHSRVVP